MATWFSLPGWQTGISASLSRSMLRYLSLSHRVPTLYHRRADTRTSATFASGNASTTPEAHKYPRPFTERWRKGSKCAKNFIRFCLPFLHGSSYYHSFREIKYGYPRRSQTFRRLSSNHTKKKPCNVCVTSN